MTNPWGDAFADLAWSRIKPWLYVGAAVIGALILWRAYALGAKHEATRWVPKVERLRTQLGDAEAGIAVLNAGLQRQSQAILEAGRETEQTKKRVNAILEKARKRKPDPIVAELLEAKPGATFCPVEDVNRQAWEKLQ